MRSSSACVNDLVYNSYNLIPHRQLPVAPLAPAPFQPLNRPQRVPVEERRAERVQKALRLGFGRRDLFLYRRGLARVDKVCEVLNRPDQTVARCVLVRQVALQAELFDASPQQPK